MWFLHVLVLIFSHQTACTDVPDVVRTVTIKPFDQETFLIPVTTWPKEGESLKVVSEHVPDPGRSSRIRGTVAFSVLYDQRGNQWQLKISEGASNRAEKNICGDILSKKLLNANATTANSLSISAYSDVSHNLTFSIKVETVTDFTMEVNETRTMTGITTDAPRVIRYTIPEDDQNHFYQLSVTSEDRRCMYVGISRGNDCFKDKIKSIKSSRLWARMLKRGFFNIDPAEFGPSFYVTLLPVKNSSECHSIRSKMLKFAPPSKNVTVKMIQKSKDYSKPVTLCVVSTFACGVLILAILLLGWHWQHKYNAKIVQRATLRVRVNKKVFESNGRAATKEVSISGHPESLSPSQSPPKMRHSGAFGVSFRPSDRPDKPYSTIKSVADIPDSKEIGEMKKLCLDFEKAPTKKKEYVVSRFLQDKLTVASTSELIKNDNFFRRQRSKTFLLLLPLCSVYYLLPSIQMVYATLRRYKETGSLELCSLNFGCSRPFGTFDDFNHIISNCGYISYGVIFIFIVHLKRKCLLNKTKQEIRGKFGIPAQHSLFYCMGICMILQGIFSVIYHMCPSNTSLQFDTTMMYIMLILVFVKTYQFRHPDFSFDAYTVMYSLLLILILEAASLYIAEITGKTVFYSIFGISYILILIYVVTDFYFNGAIGTSFPKFLPAIIHNSCHNKHILYPHRLLIFMVIILINIALMVYFCVHRTSDEGVKSLSTPILVILGLNAPGYLLMYMVNKVIEVWRCQESRGWKSRKVMRVFSLLLLILVIILGGIAMSFYKKKLQERNRTPPESR